MILDVDELSRLGAYYQDLLESPSWIIRRVTSFEYLEEPSAALRTSLTIDGPELRHRLDALNKQRQTVELPLGLFPKSLFGSFTVCDDSGSALPLLSSEYDSDVAVGVMVHELLSQQIPSGRITLSVLEKLRRIASRQDGDGIIQHLDWMAGINDVDPAEVESRFGHDLFRVLGDLGDVDAFFDLLDAFGAQYMPIVQMPISRLEKAFVIKHSEVTHSPELGLYKKTGGLRRLLDFRGSYLLNPKGGTISIKAVNLGLEGSQHFRVQAPAGTVITNATMIDPETGEQSLQKHLVHLTPRWASLYTKFSTHLGQHDVRVTLIPDIRTTMLPAIAALMLSVFVLGTGVALQIFDSVNPGRGVPPRLDKIAANSSGAIVALFLLLPSLYMLALVRRDEHGVATGLLRQPRYVITCASVAVVASAVPATFSVSSRLLIYPWIIALCAAIIVLILICWHWRMVERLKNNTSGTWNLDDFRGGPLPTS